MPVDMWHLHAEWRETQEDLMHQYSFLAGTEARGMRGGPGRPDRAGRWAQEAARIAFNLYEGTILAREVNHA